MLLLLPFFLFLAPVGSAQNKTHSRKRADQAKSLKQQATQAKENAFIKNGAPLAAESVQNFQTEEELSSALLSLWSLSNGRTPSSKTLERAGISKSQIASFKEKLPPEADISKNTRRDLKAPYNDETRVKKFEARETFINFVSSFQKSFPKYASIIPDMLTAWGETRDITGFLSADSMLLQAKMATVIQVLRNRTDRDMNSSQELRRLGEAQSKWRVATKRYQFTSFEPFDVNLRVLALGPKFEKAAMELESMTPHDRFALQTLARVILRMESGDIKVTKPISLTPTRHYLTPTLLRFSTRNEKLVKKRISKNPRLGLIRIPSKDPRFLAIVPNWSRQNALIEKPTVMIKELINSFSEQGIPPEDFVYFHGVL